MTTTNTLIIPKNLQAHLAEGSLSIDKDPCAYPVGITLCISCGHHHIHTYSFEGHRKHYILGRYAPLCSTFCIRCLCKAEADYVSTILDHDLPLYISHPWVGWEAQLVYKLRLETLT